MLENLKSDQKQVVYSNSNKILCLAGAGTGKTYCMLGRIERIVADGVDPESILVLTFTNAAAFEMESRFKDNVSLKTYPTFKTFHAFCYDVLASNKSLRLKLGYKAVPSIADEAQERRIMEEAKLITSCKLSNAKIEGRGDLTKQDEFDLLLLQKTVKKLMINRNLITFDKLSEYISSLFQEDDENILIYKLRYKYLFVDEFQDTDKTQFNFVMSFQSSNLYVTGDCLQSIYGFRGADSSLIKNLADDETWATFRLSTNYRSACQICEYANDNNKHMDEKYSIHIRSSRINGTVEIIHDFDKFWEHYEAIGSTAILMRTNKEVNYMKSELGITSDSTVSKSKITEMKCILRSVLDSSYFVDWFASYLPEMEYIKYIRSVKELESLGETYDLSDFLIQFRDKLFLDKIRTLNDIDQIIKNEDSVEEDEKNIRDRLSFPGSIPISHATNTKDMIVSMIRGLDDFQTTVADDLYIGTIHSVKGLEFDNVILIGVDGKSFPLTSEENQNLFYVGITRARTKLFVLKGDIM